MTWDLSRLDWQERIQAGQSLLPDLPLLNQTEADNAAGIFDSLRLPDVPGKPKLATAGGQWFRDIVRALHGSFDPATGVRHIREAFILAAKKSSKTSYSAALMLTSLLMNRRPRGEFILVAPTQSISELAFSQVVGMIQADAFLSTRFHIRDHLKRVEDRTNGATLVVKSFDVSIMTGTRSSGILMDEIHLVSGTKDADRVIGQARGGLISQPEGFLIFISTQSERPPAGVFRQELTKARAIRDGRIEGAMLPVLYEMPASVDWRDPQHWHMVSPNHGLSMQVERLWPDYQAARESGIGEEIRWASQHLNVEIGMALSSDRWAGADYWQQQADTSMTLDSLLERSDVVTIGIDGGGLDDLLGLAVIGRDKDSREWLHWGRAWAHPSVLQQRKSETGRFEDFARDGDLIMVETIGQDIEQIADLCEMVHATGKLSQIGLDPMGIGAIVDALAERDITCVVGVPQGIRLSGALKTCERKLADRTFHHCGQPLMAWNVSNGKIELKGSALSLTKQASGVAKIDALIALLAASSLMSANPLAQGPSDYGSPARPLFIL